MFSTHTEINVTTYRSDSINDIAVDAYAMWTAVEFAANLIANTEYKTYKNGKEYKGEQWALMNYRPNVNQTATEFWREFICKALYYGEVLVVPYLNQWIIADNFSRENYAVSEQSFTQVSRGDFTFYKSFKMSEVIYVKYPNENATMLRIGILEKYNTLINAASDSFVKASGEKGILEIPQPAYGTPDFETKFKDLMANRFKSFFKDKNAVLPLFAGMKYVPQTSGGKGTEVTDLLKLVDDALCKAAQAYNISPVLMKGEIEGIKDALNLTLTVCADPFVNAVSEQISAKMYTLTEIAGGTFVRGDTSNIKHIDIFDIATSVDKLISSGFMSPDMVMEAAGLVPTGEPWAQKHYITKNYEPADSATSSQNN